MGDCINNKRQEIKVALKFSFQIKVIFKSITAGNTLIQVEHFLSYKLLSQLPT